MKKTLIAVLVVLGVSVSAGVFACDGSGHGKMKSGTAAPAVPAPAK
jgi:hypothetical protein